MFFTGPVLLQKFKVNFNIYIVALGILYLGLLLLPLTATARERPRRERLPDRGFVMVGPSHETYHKAIEQVVLTTKTASWYQKSQEIKGKEDVLYGGKTYWSGERLIRMDIMEGYRSGATSILKGETVTGWRRGLLRFIKVSFHYREKKVRSLRGNDMTIIGFLDDLAYLLQHWPTAKIRVKDDKIIIRFPFKNNLESIMWLEQNPIRVYQHEIYEDGNLVEKHEYQNIEYNVTFPSGTFDT